MLQGLARAGADVVMHGLIPPEEAQQRTADIEREFGVKCSHSAANVMKPAEIRCAIWHALVQSRWHQSRDMARDGVGGQCR